MGKKTRFLRIFVSILLCTAIFLPQPGKAADIYFTSINDNLLPLTADSMPLWFSGMLYVPYTVFDHNATGQNLGVSSSYNRVKKVVRVYNLDGLLNFDITTGRCWDDITGEEYYGRAIIRNGKPYVSLRTVCERFGLNYSYLSMEQGYLIRIKNSSVVLSDARFIDAAQNLIERRLKEYNQSIAPPQTTPSPSTDNTGDSEEEDNNKLRVDTYLAFACEDILGMEKILNALQTRDDLAVFFMTPELMREQGDLIRRILGQGHSVGVWAQGTSLEQVQERVKLGNDQLEQQAFTRTTLVLTGKEWQNVLEQQGLVCWKGTLTLEPSDTVGPNYYAGVVSQRLKGRTKATYLTFEGGENTARVLSAVLRQLEKENYIVRIPLETRI